MLGTLGDGKLEALVFNKQLLFIGKRLYFGYKPEGIDNIDN